MSMPSLKPLNILDGYWCRSNILKWHKDAMFVPHVDTIVPSMWIRLWASMSPNLVVRFARDGELAPVRIRGRVPMAAVAQWIRATSFYLVGREFESLQPRHANGP